MDKVWKKSLRKAIKSQELEVRRFIMEFDPLGIGSCCPVYEYDDLVRNVVGILNRKDYTLEDRKEKLTEIIRGYADISIKYNDEVIETVNRILFWWQSQTIK